MSPDRTLNIVHGARFSIEPRSVILASTTWPVIITGTDETREMREDLFTVVSDIVRTDSVDYADVVLPACSHFEHAELYAAYGQHFLQRADPVIPPVGEALPNTEIFRRLAARFGFTESAFLATDTELMDDALERDDVRLNGLRPSQLPTDKALLMTFDGEDAMLFKTTLPRTPSGKVELQSDYLAQTYGQPLPTYRPVTSPYPLTLISPSSDQRTTSTFGGLSYSDQVWLDIHPQDAESRQITDGALVRVWNDLGEVFLPARLTDTICPGVISSDKGLVRTNSNGQTVSA